MSGGEIAEGIAAQFHELSILNKIARESNASIKAVEKVRDGMAPNDTGERYVMVSRGGSIIDGGTFVGLLKEGQTTLEPNLHITKPFTIYPKMPPLKNPMAEQELEAMRQLAERNKAQAEAAQLAAAEAKAAVEAEQVAAAKAKAAAEAAQVAAAQAKAAADAAQRASAAAERDARRNGRELQREMKEQKERYKREGGAFRMPGA
jgi:pyruvate/2-oxoglutarate dehydrogenase complex dihydrolipoamide acyltransferase (E2) component